METTTQTVCNVVEVPVKETGWHRFWQKLDGNKTLILSCVATTVTFVPIPEPYKAITLGILGLLGAKTGYDHVANGGFKRSVKGIRVE